MWRERDDSGSDPPHSVLDKWLHGHRPDAYAAAARGEMHITSGAKRLGLVLVVPSISYSIFYYPGALLALH